MFYLSDPTIMIFKVQHHIQFMHNFNKTVNIQSLSLSNRIPPTTRSGANCPNCPEWSTAGLVFTKTSAWSPPWSPPWPPPWPPPPPESQSVLSISASVARLSPPTASTLAQTQTEGVLTSGLFWILLISNYIYIIYNIYTYLLISSFEGSRYL